MMVIKYFRGVYSSLLERLLKKFLNHRPKTIHKVLEEEFVAKFDEIVVIGDIHGCYDELKLLVDQIQQNSQTQPKRILKIILGDLVNKGPKNIEVVDFLMQNPDDFISVRGNHDIVVMDEYIRFQKTGHFTREKNVWIKELSKKQFKFLKQLPYTISIPTLNVIIVHAGLLPNVPLKKQKLQDMVEMRNIIKIDVKDKVVHIASSKFQDGVSWAQVWPGPSHVYFGHDARRKLQQHQFATGLDTGAVYGEQLTGKFIKGPRTGQYIVVDALKCYAGSWKQKKQNLAD